MKNFKNLLLIGCLCGVFIVLSLLFFFNSRFNEKFVGKWQGVYWTCDKPLDISLYSILMPNLFESKFNFNEQSDALIFSIKGPFLVANKDGSKLTYSDPNGVGDSFDLIRCTDK